MKKVMPAFLIWFFASFGTVFAANISVSELPSNISADPFGIKVSVSGAAANTTNYLRVDLFVENTTNYFGETFNNTDWYGGSTGTNYYPVNILNDGTATTSLTARVGNPDSTDYPGAGEYKLRIRRYTASGSAASGDTQIIQSIYIDLNNTPTPTVTIIPTNVPTPTETPIPTFTPTPTPTQTPIPTPTSEPTITPIPTITLSPTPSPTLMPNNHGCIFKYRIIKILWIYVKIPLIYCTKN